MATSTRDLLGWSEQGWTAVPEVIDKAVAQTAKCRQIVPKGPEKIGEQSVIVHQIAATPAGGAMMYGPDKVATPVHLFFDLQIDDQRLADEHATEHIMASAAASLGA